MEQDVIYSLNGLETLAQILKRIQLFENAGCLLFNIFNYSFISLFRDQGVAVRYGNLKATKLHKSTKINLLAPEFDI
jgi:hypothetical protein